MKSRKAHTDLQDNHRDELMGFLAMSYFNVDWMRAHVLDLDSGPSRPRT